MIIYSLLSANSNVPTDNATIILEYLISRNIDELYCDRDFISMLHNANDCGSGMIKAGMEYLNN